MPLDLLGPANAPGAVTTRPGDTRAFGATDTFFKDCSSPDLDDGTEFQAAWFNQVLAVLRGLVRGNGLTSLAADVVTLDNANDDILLTSAKHLIQRGQPQYGVDTGAANAMVVSLSPAAAEYKAGMTIRVKAVATNTGATTINVNGLGVKNIIRSNGSALVDSHIVANAIIELIYDGTAFQMPAAVAPVMTHNLTLYVNGAIGSDLNDGVSNTVGRALATVQGAINRAFSYPPSQYTITVEVADGTYAATNIPLHPGPSIIVNGNAGTPANVVLAGGASSAFTVQGPNTVTVNNLTVTSASGYGFVAYGGSTLTTNNTRSGAVSAPVFTSQGGTVNVGSHTFAGNCEGFFYARSGQINLFAPAIYTVSGTLTVSTATAQAAVGGSISVTYPTPPTFAGTGVTGMRYLVATNGIIDTQGLGVNFFPGTIAGTTATGGQYA